MGNVVGFPNSGRRDQNVDQEEQRRLRRERASVLRSRLEAGHAMLPADQRVVAENLWRLLEHVKSRGIKKAQTLGAIQPKHLGQYTINPSWSEDRKIKARLNKKVKKYLSILDGAVKEAGLDADETLMDVFGGTSMDAPEGSGPAAPEYEDLARKLRDVADVVAAKHRLQDYFQRVARQGHVLAVQNDLDADDVAERVDNGEPEWLSPDEIELGFVKSRWSSLDWPITFFEATREHQEFDEVRYLPPYPTVVLGAWQIGPGFAVKVESETVPAGGEHGPFEGTTSGSDWMELRLCIVPVGAELRPTPALRVWTSVLVGDLRAGMPTPDDYSDEWTILRFAGERIVPAPTKQDDPERFFFNCQTGLAVPTNREIPVLLSRERKSLPFPISKYGKVSDLHHEAKLCQFLPITGAILEDWLGHGPLLQGWHLSEIPTHVRVLGDALLEDIRTSEFSEFATGTIAADLDHCLHDTHSPLARLDECAEKFVQLFEEASAAARISREKKVARLEARLRATRKESRDV
jgi:hypothetical protein